MKERDIYNNIAFALKIEYIFMKKIKMRFCFFFFIDLSPLISIGNWKYILLCVCILFYFFPHDIHNF